MNQYDLNVRCNIYETYRSYKVVGMLSYTLEVFLRTKQPHFSSKMCDNYESA